MAYDLPQNPLADSFLPDAAVEAFGHLGLAQIRQLLDDALACGALRAARYIADPCGGQVRFELVFDQAASTRSDARAGAVYTLEDGYWREELDAAAQALWVDCPRYKQRIQSRDRALREAESGAVAVPA